MEGIQAPVPRTWEELALVPSRTESLEAKVGPTIPNDQNWCPLPRSPLVQKVREAVHAKALVATEVPARPLPWIPLEP